MGVIDHFKKRYKWLKLFLSSVRKFWCIFVVAILKTNPFSHHLSKCNFIQNFDFWRFFAYLWNDSNEFFWLIHCNTLKFQDKPILRTGQKSALQHSLFWRYANFSKLMRTIHISMTSTFQCEYCQRFTFKRCDKFKPETHKGSVFLFVSSITSQQFNKYTTDQ